MVSSVAGGPQTCSKNLNLFDQAVLLRTRMTALQQWAGRWGDIASILGVLLTIVGFTFTIYNVRRSKSAAEATRDSISAYDAIEDLSAATSIMDEIKRLQRLGAWAVVPDRYSELRRRLITIKESRSTLTSSQRESLMAAIERFAALERRVDRAISMIAPVPNPAKLNDIVSTQIDEVQIVLLALKGALRTAK